MTKKKFSFYIFEIQLSPLNYDVMSSGKKTGLKHLLSTWKSNSIDVITFRIKWLRKIISFKIECHKLLRRFVWKKEEQLELLRFRSSNQILLFWRLNFTSQLKMCDSTKRSKNWTLINKDREKAKKKKSILLFCKSVKCIILKSFKSKCQPWNQKEKKDKYRNASKKRNNYLML